MAGDKLTIGMHPPPDFTIGATLQEEDGIVLLRAEDTRDHRFVLLKTLSTERPLSHEIDRLQRDCEIAQSLDLATTMRATECIVRDAHPFVVMEDFGGVPLEQLLERPMSLDAFFPLAIQLAEAVAQLHSRGVIHKELRPTNVFVNPTTGLLKLSNFGSATRIPWQQLDAGELVLRAGMLPYMAPEQTGRMNRAVDFRSDLYALGVIFYRMLAGHLPFDAHDAMEWVHCHIARTQKPLSDQGTVPQVLSDVVDKLLAKMADNRYQTAAGLRTDLETCWRQFSKSGRIEPFALGSADVSARLIVPQRLYGREREVDALVEAFERVLTSETSELVLVVGYSGIGKSALVQELYRPIIRQRCYFLTGKFDQYKRDVPYALLAQAFGGLIRQLLSESEARVADWRERIRAAVDVNARLIVETVPELELLIGPQAPVPDLNVAESQRRLFAAFEQFVGVFARPERPLVLFLDDLQWVDAASLELLEHLITAPRLRSFLLIGAYRDNEVGPAHPVTLMVQSVQRAGRTPRKIELSPLTPALVHELTRDAMQGTSDVAPLAEMLYRKTLGNPFFLIQMLKTLVAEGLIYFDAGIASWRWELERIAAEDYSDNVADLMTRRLSRLTPETQLVMQLAAALGNRGSVRMLAAIAEREIGPLLEEAAREGLLLLHAETYAFLHDRVRQAAYVMLPVLERPAVHVRIGRRLLADLSPGAVEAQVFDVVDQLNRGLALITDPSERLDIAALDLLAGKRAKASGAFVMAVMMLETGIGLLPPDAWDAHYEITFSLHFHAAESRYLTGAFAEADVELARLANRARTSRHMAAATEVRADLMTAQGRIAEAIDVALNGLTRFGLSLPKHPTEDEVDSAYRLMWELVGDRAVESLASLPTMDDADHNAMYRLLMCVHPTAYFFDFNLYAMLACHEVILCLRHGNPEDAAFGYAVLAASLIARYKQYAEAASFVNLGEELANRAIEPRNQLRAWMPLWGLASWWVRPFREGLEGLRRCFRLGVQLGDVTYASYSGVFLCAIRVLRGDPLEEVEHELAETLDWARSMKFGLMRDAALGQFQLLRCLRGETERFGSLDGTSFDEAAFERAEATQYYVAAWYFASKALARFWAGDVDASWEAVETITRAQKGMDVLPFGAEYSYVRALTMADRYASQPSTEQAAALAEIREYHAHLHELERICAESWHPRRAMISAELARLTGDIPTAEAAYEEAIRAAASSGQSQQHALAYERAARFYRGRGFELTADAYIQEAHACYQRWGAHGKVRQLEVRYPSLARRTNRAVGSTVSEALDAISIAKASRAISGTIVWSDLQTVLLRLSMENAGARRAALLLRQDGRWTLEAELDIDHAGPPSPARLLTEVDTMSPELIAYVQRTREPVVIDDAARDPIFAGTFARSAGRGSRSVLCMPIVRQDHLIGLLYLENDLVVGAFSSEKLAIIEQLAAQAAISLENARLYQDLRREIEERKEAQTALQANQMLLQAIIDNSAAVIFVKDRSGRYLLVNSQFGTTLGVEKSYVVGKTDPELFPPEQAARFRVEDEQVFASRVGGQVDDLILTTAGPRTFLSLKFPLLDPAGRPYAICGIATDISERKRAEQALHDAIHVRDNFLRIASHELRTPLTPLQLQLELIRDMLRNRQDVPREALADKLGLSLRQVGRLHALVVEMLDVARLQSGRFALQIGTVDLGAVCRDVANDLELELARAGIVLTLECDEPVVGQWDRSRLEQIVTNLLTNAMKFGANKPIELAVRSFRGHAILTVQDHGIGIAPADQQRIFAPFERAVSTNYAGLGMGLYITREIVVAHGGMISVESEVGRGAKFTVTLPLTPPPAGD